MLMRGIFLLAKIKCIRGMSPDLHHRRFVYYLGPTECETKLTVCILTERARVYNMLVLFVHHCIGLCQTWWRDHCKLTSRLHGCMHDFIYSRVQPMHSALFVNLAEHYLLMSSSCFIKPNVKTPLWDPTRHVFPLWKRPSKENEKLCSSAPVKTQQLSVQFLLNLSDAISESLGKIWS